MAFDGIVIANLVKEFSDALTGGKIAKITQTERDELLFTIKNFRETKRLLLSVNASLPLAYLTDTNKQGPMTAEFLHAASQAHRKRTHRVGQPAGSGTLYSF